MHVIVDGKARNRTLMTDKERMCAYLRELADVVGMTIFGEPVVVGYPWPGSQDADALSAVCFLAESSIVVHTYPEKHFAFVDVFSCKDFNSDRVYNYIRRSFVMDDPKLIILARGLDGEGQCRGTRILRGVF